MSINREQLIAARKASGHTIESAAHICAISKPTYVEREKNPDSFRVGELTALYESMSDTAKEILSKAIKDIFLSK